MARTNNSYAVGIHGANYSHPDQETPGHWVLCDTLDDVRSLLWYLSENMPAPAAVYGTRMDLEPLDDTPGYGDPGDGAIIYRVTSANIQRETFKRAHERGVLIDWYAIDFDYPAYAATFGPRGGIKLERA